MHHSPVCIDSGIIYSALTHPHKGSQIFVVGLIPNGTDPITANYSIDGGPPQTRSVPSNNGCGPIPVDAFFSMTGLEEGKHFINITMVELGNRPFMFNYFAVDAPLAVASSPKSDAKQSHAGELAGIVVAVVALLVFLSFAVFTVIRRRRRYKKECPEGDSESIFKTTDADSVSSVDKRNSFGE